MTRAYRLYIAALVWLLRGLAAVELLIGASAVITVVQVMSANRSGTSLAVYPNVIAAQLTYLAAAVLCAALAEILAQSASHPGRAADRPAAQSAP